MWSCYFFFQLSFVSLSSQIMLHFKFVSWQSGARPPEPPTGASPLDPTGLRPGTRASLHLYSLPDPAHHRMPAIIKATQAAKFHVLIG